MIHLFKTVQIIAKSNGRSNPEADKIIEEKLAIGENFDVKFLFDLYNLDIETKDEEGNTALLWSALGADIDGISRLIEVGANLNAQDKRGYTALHWAIMFQYINVVEVLVNAGADINVKCNSGHTALQLATRNRLYKDPIAELVTNALNNLNISETSVQRIERVRITQNQGHEK